MAGPAAGSSPSGTAGVVHLPVDDIIPNPFQPRRIFAEEHLQDLASSIREHGVLQPVIVSRSNGHYSLVVGERRWRAARVAGLEVIPAIVREFAEAEGLAVALVENIQRQDLNPLEEATAFQFLMREHGLKQEDVAVRVGKSRSAVANTVRLLQLPGPIQEDVESGALSAGHARALLALEDANLQRRTWLKIKKLNLSVRQTELMVRNLLEARDQTARTRKRLPPEWIDVQEDLQRRYSAQVRICPRTKKAGKIEIHYASPDELERLVQGLMGRLPGGRRAQLRDDLL